MQLWLVLASIGRQQCTGGNTFNIQASQRQNTLHSGGSVLCKPRRHSGSEIMRRRSRWHCPQEHPLPGLQNLNLPAISAHMIALDLTVPEACFALKPELFRRYP